MTENDEPEWARGMSDVEKILWRIFAFAFFAMAVASLFFPTRM